MPMHRTSSTVRLARRYIAEVLLKPPRARPEEPEWPFEAQTDFQGIKIDIENQAGSTRSGTNEDGTPWSTTMQNHYGEIRRTEGTDGDKLDCYLGPNETAKWVYVIHQVHPGNHPQAGEYDEDKVMLGFTNANSAIAAYQAHYDRDDFFGGMSMMPLSRFKAWIKDPKAKGKAVQPPVQWKPKSYKGPETPPPIMG